MNQARLLFVLIIFSSAVGAAVGANTIESGRITEIYQGKSSDIIALLSGCQLRIVIADKKILELLTSDSPGTRFFMTGTIKVIPSASNRYYHLEAKSADSTETLIVTLAQNLDSSSVKELDDQELSMQPRDYDYRQIHNQDLLKVAGCRDLSFHSKF
jgi:hypothetical protein